MNVKKSTIINKESVKSSVDNMTSFGVTMYSIHDVMFLTKIQ
jgi:hypothetical protein